MTRLIKDLYFTSTIVLAAGAIGVRAGVDRLFQNEKRCSPAGENEGSLSKPLSMAPAIEAGNEVEPLRPERHFTIKRTKSEVGYVYWILEGHGKYKCFVLCDSWDDAVMQAKARLEGIEPAGGQMVSDDSTAMSVTFQA